MAIVGSAEIIVRAITNQIKADIQKGLQDARPVIASEGEKAGKSFSDGFGKGSSGNLGKSFEDSLKRANLPGVAGKAGEDAGSSLIDAAGNEIDKGASDLGNRAERSFSGAGKRGGDGFLKGFLNSDFGKASGKASEAFTQLIGVGNLLGPAIAGLVGLLGSAAAGLFAMAGAASQAAGALAVLPGLLAVAAQAFGTIKLAFSGVSSAISSGFKQATSTVTNTAAATLSNTRAIADAQTALARAQQSAVQAMIGANQRVADAGTALVRARQSAAQSLSGAIQQVAQAEIDVANAQRNTLAAQQALNAARQEGVKQLRDLAFSAEDAGLAEQQAGLDLQDARTKLEQAQALPPDDQARVQAELAFKQADLAYREAKARNQDLQTEEKKAAKAGVDGTDAVVSAKQKINDAVKSQHDAEQALTDARQAEVKTQISNAQSINDAEQALAKARQARAQTEISNSQNIHDAQQRLARAIQDQALASSKASTAANAYQTALARLSPAARTFVEHLVAMKSQFDALKQAAGSELFPKLTTSIDTLATGVFPKLEDNLKVTGSLLGDAALGLTNIFRSGKNNRLGQVLAGNNDILKTFTKRGKDGENTFSRMERVALRLLVAIHPLTKRFAEFINQLSFSAERGTRSADQMKKLTGFFNKAGDVAAQLGRIFHNLGKALLILFDGSKKSGQGLLDSFEQATHKLDKFLGKLKKNGDLQSFFKKAAFNLRAFGHLFDTIFVQIVKLGDTKASGKFAKSLDPAIKNIGDIGLALEKASPALGPFATQMTELIKGLTNSGQISTFLKTLTVIAKVLSDIVNNGVAQKILLVAGTFFAIHRAVAFALKPIGFFFKAIIGGPRNALEAMTKLRDGVSKVGKFFSTIKSDGFKKAFGDLKEGSDQSKKALEEQMGVDELKAKSLKALGDAADKSAHALKRFRDAAAPLPGEMEAIGAETAAGLTTGFESNSQGFVDALVQVAREAVVAVKAELGIASPSKVFEKIGREAGEGYVLGLESESGAAAAAGAQLGTASAAATAESSAAGGLGSASGAAGAAAKGAEKEAATAEKAAGKFASVGAKAGKGLSGLLGLFLPFEIGLEGAGAAIGAAIVPILAIIAAIAAFIGIFILLYKKSPQFKLFIDNIIGKFKDLGHWIKDVVLPIIVNFAKWIGEKFVALVVPPLDAFFGFVNEGLPKVGAAFGVAFHFIAQVWKNQLHPALDDIISVIKFLWKYIVHPYLKLIELQFKIAFGIIKFNWEHVLKPAIEAIISIIKFLWKYVFKPNFELIAGVVKATFAGIKLVWDNVLHPVITAVGTAIGKISDAFQTVFDRVKTLWDKFTSGFKTLKSDLATIIGDIVNKFKDIGTGVAGAFKGLGKFAAQGLNSFINFLNNNLIDKVNSVTSKFGFNIDHIPTISLAEGGKVRGPGGDHEDKVLAALSNNEFVIKATAAKAIGYNALDAMNKTGQLPMGGIGFPHPHIPSFGDIKNLAGDTINGVKNVGETIAKKGLGAALDAIVKGAEKLMSGPFPRGKGFNDLFYGILDKLATAVDDWGGDIGKGVGATPTGNIPANLKKSGKWAFPVAGSYYYNSGYPYGANPTPGYYHTGSDFDAKVGTPLVAMGAGHVTGVTNLGDRSYGRYVTINYGAFQTLYAHMNGFAAGLRAGMATKAGTPIGQVGWYGNVSPKSPAGAHLHLETSTIGKFGSMGSTVSPIDLLRRLGFKFAKGGVVAPTDGGVLGVIGEAGHHERIEPLDNEGFSKRDRAILDMIKRSLEADKGGDTLIVNPSQGMDEIELADLVARRMKFRRRTGT